MKLKKIASLALAGVMAVSMLTACNTTSGQPQNPTTPRLLLLQLVSLQCLKPL